MQKNADYWVKHLNLDTHPEGGYYKETYRSETEFLPENDSAFNGKRNVCTGIYFLITNGNFSAFHRIKSDEMWHFYDGAPLNVYVIHQDGSLEILKVGIDAHKGELPQAVVPANTWFASESSGDFSLVGCTVSPGFDFSDFELAQKSKLSKEFPQHKEIIERLCR